MNYYDSYKRGLYQQSNIRNDENSDRVMNVIGEGMVEAIPDTAVVSFSVITKDKNLTKAQNENARIVNNVFAELQKAGIKSDQIATTNYFIRPNYDYIDGKQVFREYEVINQFTVTLNDITKVGETIDLAVDSGVNSVNNISFEVSDLSKYYQDALSLAVKDSGNKAKTIGNTLGVSVIEIPVKIEEQGMQSVPLTETVFKAADATTPIQPGPTEVRAVIKAIYNY